MSANCRKNELRRPNAQPKVKPSTIVCRRESVPRSELSLGEVSSDVNGDVTYFEPLKMSFFIIKMF
jgi:hypothetical protein